MAGPRVLTFNFHEPYLCLMARTGFPITVGQYESGDLQRPWHTTFRPIPPNIHLAPEAKWRRDLQAGKFDVLVVHNETNAASVFKSATPALLVCHNRRSFIRTNFPADEPDELRAFDRLLDRLQERFAFVFISESKRDDYGVPGRVILPGIDVEEYGGYVGDRAEVLRVGNSMRERYRMFDVDFQEAVVTGIPNRVVGVNALIPGSEPAKSFDDLLWHYRHLRAYLHVSREEFEDGYNLAMIEAMACGMPVVSLANPSSPLTDGADGFASYDAEMLRTRLQNLLKDPGLARSVGQRGRETVAAAFPMDRFVQAWREALEEAAEERGPRLRWLQADPPPRRVVLLQYTAGPASVGRFLEWPLRRNHEVITLGPRQPNRHDAPRYPSQQIALPNDDPEHELRKLVTANRSPELQVYLRERQSPPPLLPEALSGLPKICWLLDEAPDAALAFSFDGIFCAQAFHVEQAHRAGLTQVAWLPPACAPELFTGVPRQDVVDVLVMAATHRREDIRKLLDPVGRVAAIDDALPYDAAAAMMRARIIVHVPRSETLDQTLVQAMGSGALVMTAPVPSLESLFEDGKHLVVWHSEDELEERVKQYLADADSRIRIAEVGKRHVLAHHTFEQRMERIMSAVASMPVEQQPQDARLEVGGYYRSPRPELAAHVPLHTRRMLDVGCGAGEFGRALKAERGVKEVVGIEIVENAWNIAKTVLDKAILGNIEELELPFPDGHFDCITCGDVLEHLVNPLDTVKKLMRVLAPGGILVASIPNARYYRVVEMLANGRWIYQDAGIMDRTHLRFFTAVEMIEMFRNAGMRVRTIAPLSMIYKEALPISEDGFVEMEKMRIGPLTAAEYHDFLVYQYLVIAEHRSGDLLQRAQAHLDAKDNEKAFHAAQGALDEGEDRASALRIMAKAGARLGKVAEAEAWYRESLALRDDPETQGEYGLVLFALGRCVDAKNQIDAAHRRLPNHSRILSGLGLCDLASGNVEAAFDHFQASLDQNFDNEAALEHLVGAAQQLGRLNEAEPYVRHFVDFYPGNLDMGCVYAAVLCEMGRADEARERLDNVLLLNPTHERARSLLEQIDSRT